MSPTPRLDAELLMAHALGISREALLLAHLDMPAPATFAPLLARRLRHEPIAYITGTRAFWTIELAVGPGVLVPRADSETLIEAAVAHFGKCAPTTILDLGTGPGTLLLAALDQWPGATGVGVDTSEPALGYAARNAAALGMAERARFVRGDWAAGVFGPFDLILANPPYIGSGETLPDEVRTHEPALALFAGADGLDAYRIIAPQVPALLTQGGVACIEVGVRQAEAVSTLLQRAGLHTATRADLAGIARCVVARRA